MPLPKDRSIGDDEPMMLRDAAALMFPDGSVNEKTLRRQRDAGTLDCFRICGRDYTTLAAMRTMCERCKVTPKRITAKPVPNTEFCGRDAFAAAMATVAALRGPPSEPRGKQARKPPPEPPRPKTGKRQLSPRIPKTPVSER